MMMMFVPLFEREREREREREGGGEGHLKRGCKFHKISEGVANAMIKKTLPPLHTICV